MEDILEHAPRKRYPDPVPARHVSRRVSTIVEEPRRSNTPQVVQPPEAVPVKCRPASRAEQVENKPQLSRQRSVKVDGSPASAKNTESISPDATHSVRGQTIQPVSKLASIPVRDHSPIETTERESNRAALSASVRRSPAPTSASNTRASTPAPSGAERGKVPRSEKLPDPLSRKTPREKEIAPSARESPENRVRGSSHDSRWTETQLSSPDSRQRRDHSPEAHQVERDHRNRSSSSDERSQRGYRLRSPSSPRHRISIQGPAKYMGMNERIPQQPFAVQGNSGQLIRSSMMPSAGYRAIMAPPPPPRPPIMPLVPRSLPPLIMSPPQAPLPWMGSMSPPMANWVTQRPTSGIHAGMVPSNGINPPMTVRNSMASLGRNYGNNGTAGTRRRSRPMESTRTPRDRSTRYVYEPLLSKANSI